MEQLDLIIIGVVIVAYALVSARLERSSITPPMAFVAIGVLFALFGRLDLARDDAVVRGLMEATLVIALFTDATRIDFTRLRSAFRLPLRLLTVGMVLSVLLGALAALWLFPGLSVGAALVLGVVLAPTDAALGKAVVSSPQIPVRIRQTLNVESGLNDGLALPLLFIALAIDGALENSPETASFWVGFTIRSIGWATLVGLGVGWTGGRLLRWALRTGSISLVFSKLAGLALAFVAFTVTEELSASGFIAAFVAGAALGHVAREACGPIYEFAEVEGQLLALLTFLFFGAITVVPTIEQLTWQVVVHALLSLTVIRMIPVSIALLKSGLRPESVAFIGWFGPRGLATILFSLVVLREAGMAAQETIFEAASFVVLLSIFLHGITSVPLAKAYAARLAREEGAGLAEMQAVEEVPVLD